MSNNELTGKDFEKFAVKLLQEIDEYKLLFKQMGLDITKYLPEVFTGENVGVHIVYSRNKKQVLFRFDPRNDRHVFSSEVKGELFNLYDPFKSWKDGQAAFGINNSSAAFINNRIRGMRPFNIQGDDIELAIENLSFNVAKYGELIFTYGFVFSFNNFIKIYKDIRGFISRFMNVIKEFKDPSIDPTLHYRYLKGLKNKMKELFFNESIPELEIDRFIEMNPVILELGLQITKPHSQVTLKNILDIYEHDLKPDLIAYDNRSRNWIIVDYKKAKRSILKNVGKVRTGLRSEVYSLKNQLRDYVRYFQEREHRLDFKNRYGFEIKRPRAMGIIGNVHGEEIEVFEDLLMEEFDQQYNIIPYNYLYENFCESVDFAFKYVKTG